MAEKKIQQELPLAPGRHRGDAPGRSGGTVVVTVGHSTRSLDEFLALLRTHDVRIVADVRAFPRSRRNPQFNIDTLPDALSGLGIGRVRTPLPDAARKAAGSAFIAAREAVDAAKRAEGRFALRAALDETATTDGAGPALEARELEPLVRLLLLVRDRRTPQGWEAIDLVREVGSQKRAAERLGISDAAVSQRLKSAVWSVDDEARPGLVRLLADLDRAADPSSRRRALSGRTGDGGDR